MDSSVIILSDSDESTGVIENIKIKKTYPKINYESDKSTGVVENMKIKKTYSNINYESDESIGIVENVEIKKTSNINYESDESIGIVENVEIKKTSNINFESDDEFPEVNFHYERKEKNQSQENFDSAFDSCENNYNLNSKQSSELSVSGSSQDSAVNVKLKKKSNKKAGVEERRAERERKKQENERQKAIKKAESKNLKSRSIQECMKYIKVKIDGNLQNLPFFNKTINNLQEANINFKVDSELIPNSISWEREIEENFVNGKGEICTRKYSKDENDIIVIWFWEEIVKKISDGTFLTTITEFCDLITPKRLTVYVYGMKSYFHHQKRTKNDVNRKGVLTVLGQNEPERKQTKRDRRLSGADKISENDFEMNLCNIQVFNNCSSRLFDTPDEIAFGIQQFTKAVAESPYKLEKNKNFEENFSSFAIDSRGIVRVDKDGNGLRRLWQQQLCQLNLCSLEVSEAICQAYGSPQQLMDAYARCTPNEGEMLLRDVPIRRAAGPVTSSRKIGPELSKKVYLLFSAEDGNVLVGTETENKK